MYTDPAERMSRKYLSKTHTSRVFGAETFVSGSVIVKAVYLELKAPPAP